MIDTVRLGQFPDPAYKTVQFSSYDRRSTVAEGPDWFANSDGFGNEPTPNFEAVLEEPTDNKPGRYLICDVQGPGAIVRTWTAAIEGTLRVVLDDAEQPIYEGPAGQFLQAGLQSVAEQAGIPAELYVQTYRQRDASYFRSLSRGVVESNGRARTRGSIFTKFRFGNMPLVLTLSP